MQVEISTDIMLPRLRDSKKILDDILENISTPELSNPKNNVAIKMINVSSVLYALIGYIEVVEEQAVEDLKILSLERKL